MGDPFWLTAAQMARLQPFLPKSHGRPRVDDRRVLSGIIFINRTGLRWYDALREYGPPKTVSNCWKRWEPDGRVRQGHMIGLAAEAADKMRVPRDHGHGFHAIVGRFGRQSEAAVPFVRMRGP